MLIINADDWGRSEEETDAAKLCYESGRITSTSAMVFMADSERAADIALEAGIEVGLHLNLSQIYTGRVQSVALRHAHGQICHFLNRSKFSALLYNPFLRQQLRDVFNVQLAEFRRLYGMQPSHFDGHQHMHLWTNALVGDLLPQKAWVRRSFTFRHGEKSAANRAYRWLINTHLKRNYRIADSFFSLSSCVNSGRIDYAIDLARSSTVEIMTHPNNLLERRWLTGNDFIESTRGVQLGTHGLPHNHENNHARHI